MSIRFTFGNVCVFVVWPNFVMVISRFDLISYLHVPTVWISVNLETYSAVLCKFHRLLSPDSNNCPPSLGEWSGCQIYCRRHSNKIPILFGRSWPSFPIYILISELARIFANYFLVTKFEEDLLKRSLRQTDKLKIVANNDDNIICDVCVGTYLHLPHKQKPGGQRQKSKPSCWALGQHSFGGEVVPQLDWLGFIQKYIYAGSPKTLHIMNVRL